MKAISIWQPHASLILSGAQLYETRSWSAPRHLIGQRIWIHAAKAIDDLIEIASYYRNIQNGCEADEYLETFRSGLVDAGFKNVADIPLGCIIGSVLLEQSIPTTEVVSSEEFGNFSSGRFAWKMSFPVLLPRPIPFRGQQGFFEGPEIGISIADTATAST